MKILAKNLIACVILTVAFYVYSISSAVVSIVASNQNLKQIKECKQAYGAMETKYMNLIGGLDIKYADRMGLVAQIGETEYIARNNSFARR